jgi:predicted acetyltransferase
MEVRTVRDEEFPAWAAAHERGFHGQPHPDLAGWRRPRVDLTRTIGAFDGSEVVGTARSFPAELTLPGGAIVPVAAVTNVTVRSTHRRQGLLTRMMELQLAEVPEMLGILIASEAPIYGRFGYGPAVEHARLTVDARFVPLPGTGSVRLVSKEELRGIAPGVYDHMRASQHGAIARSTRRWDVDLDLDPKPSLGPATPEPFHAVHLDAHGDADGYLVYRIKEGWEHRSARATLEVAELVGVNDLATVELWRYAASVDWVTTVVADDRPVVEALATSLVDPRWARQSNRADFVWVRLRDVAASLAARTYRVDDRLVLAVMDGSSTTTVALEGGPGGASCAATTGAPDLTLTVADLGAAYLGGTPLWPAAGLGRVEEHRAGAVAAFDRMFLTDRPPWCPIWF